MNLVAAGLPRVNAPRVIYLKARGKLFKRTRGKVLKERDVKSLLRMEVGMVRFIFCGLMVGALSGCAVSESSVEGDENRYEYPYKSTYKGEVEYHSITAREPLSEAFLAKMQNGLHEGFELDPGSCVPVDTIPEAENK